MAELPFDPELISEPPGTPSYNALPLSEVGSMGASPAAGAMASPAASKLDQMIEQQMALRGTLKGGLYGFFSGLAGQDPNAQLNQLMQMRQGEQRLGLQGRQVASEEQGLSLREKELAQKTNDSLIKTQLEVGKLVHDYAKTIGKTPASQRKVIADYAKGFLSPLMKSLGMEVPEKVFDAILSSPEAADNYAGIIAKRFGSDVADIKRIHGVIAGIEDPKEVIKVLDDVFKGDVAQAVPEVMRVAEQWMRNVKSSDATTRTRLGMLDATGKPLPLNGAFFLRNFAESFQSVTGKPPTPAQFVAMQDVLKDDKYAGFLGFIGLTSGALGLEREKLRQKEDIEGASLKGQAALARTKAQTAVDVAREKEIMGGKTTPLQAGAGFVHQKPGEAPVVIQEPGAKLSDVQAMRGQFEQRSKDFVTVRDFYQTLLSAEDTPAGDLNRIFSYMKMLDPQSVVREGEQATVQNARGVPEAIRARYNSLLGGGSLGPQQRLELSSQAKKIVAGRVESHKNLENEYRKIAERAKINPDDVTVDFLGPLRRGDQFEGKTSDERLKSKLKSGYFKER